MQQALTPLRGFTALALVLVLAVGIVIGAVAGPAVLRRLPAADLGSSAAAYDEGYAAAKRAVEAAGILPPEPASLMAVDGAVMAVGASSFTVAVDAPFRNPLAGMPDRREVTVGSSTALTIVAQKDRATFLKELDAFQKKGTEGAPPSPFIERPATLADLSVGDRVHVEAAADVKTAASFTATVVRITKGTVPPVPPAAPAGATVVPTERGPAPPPR